MSIKLQRALVAYLVLTVTAVVLLVAAATWAWNSSAMLTSIHARFHSRSIWEQIINLRRRELALEQAKAGVIFEPLLAGFQQRSREDLNETDQVILDYARKDQAGRFVLVLAARISLYHA